MLGIKEWEESILTINEEKMPAPIRVEKYRSTAAG
jgi:hypothetical protein